MIINKRIVTGDLDLLRFMYPNYKVVYNLDNIDSSIIYAGNLSLVDDLVEMFKDKNYDFIVYTRGMTDIDLKDRLTLVNVVFEKYKRLVPKYLMDILNDLDDDTFIRNIKHYWIYGKWETKVIESKDNFYTFIETINKSSIQMYKSFFNTIADSNSYVLESSLMTFITRVKDNKTQDVYYKYRNKLNMFSGNKLNASLNGIKHSLDYNIDNHELKLLNELICIMDARKEV